MPETKGFALLCDADDNQKSSEGVRESETGGIWTCTGTLKVFNKYC